MLSAEDLIDRRLPSRLASSVSSSSRISTAAAGYGGPARASGVGGTERLEQAVGGALVPRIELERGAQVLDRSRALSEQRERLAGLRPRVGGAHRIALVLSP